MRIEQLRQLADREEIDYQFVLSALKDYKYPRDKIHQWLKSGDLVRVKKGLYIFGETASKGFYSPEVLANLIYGPSAISLKYALAHYGLIPERVSMVTSITNKRYKYFSTPVGNFVYHYLNNKKYYVGIQTQETSSKQPFFIASPEKALSDQITIVDKKVQFKTFDDVEAYLFHNLRIDPYIFKEMDKNQLLEIARAYKSKNLVQLHAFFLKWRPEHA